MKKINREDCLTFASFDKEYNVITSSPIELAEDGTGQLRPVSENGNTYLPYSQGYQPTALYWLDLVNEYFNDIPGIENYTFVDIGAGKGKVILYNLLKKSKYKKYIGVEKDKKFYDIFNYNLKNTNIEIDKEIDTLLIDANDFDYSSQNNIYFFFYPFTLDFFTEYFKKNIEFIKNNNNYLVFIYEQDYGVSSYVGSPVYFNDAVTIYKV
jgi:SAM-dependent methyltransferase